MRPDDPLPRTREGVMLRRLAVGDLADFQAYRGDLELGRFQGWRATADGEAEGFLAEMNGAPLWRPGVWSQIGIAAAEDGVLAGDIGLRLSEDGREVMIGFSLRREAQGKGMATLAVREAMALVFECTDARRVIANTDARNVASIRLLERVGMVRVKTEPAVFRGEACVEHWYAIERGGE